MKLKDQIRRSLDSLDNQSLVLVYEQIQSLLKAQAGEERLAAAPSLDDVLNLTSSSPGEWQADVAAQREERL